MWSLGTRTGELRQITDDQADDWAPAYSADGRSVLWSSNRSGHLEIWTAEADGGGARQVTRDGVNAENPTQTPDGQWIVYRSASPERGGIWKIRTDGSDEVQIDSADLTIPHPRMRDRAFVLLPLAEIREEWSEAAESLSREGIRRLEEPL